MPWFRDCYKLYVILEGTRISCRVLIIFFHGFNPHTRGDWFFCKWAFWPGRGLKYYEELLYLENVKTNIVVRKSFGGWISLWIPAIWYSCKKKHVLIHYSYHICWHKKLCRRTCKEKSFLIHPNFFLVGTNVTPVSMALIFLSFAVYFLYVHNFSIPRMSFWIFRLFQHPLYGLLCLFSFQKLAFVIYLFWFLNWISSTSRVHFFTTLHVKALVSVSLNVFGSLLWIFHSWISCRDIGLVKI